MTTNRGEFIYRDDVTAIAKWQKAQVEAWLAPGARGCLLLHAAAIAPLGPEGDHARAAWQAERAVKEAMIAASVKAKIRALLVRPGEIGDAPLSSLDLVARANELGRLALQAYANDDYRHDRPLRAILADVATLPEPLRNAVRLDDYVWDRMVGLESDRSECTRGEITLAEFDGVDEVDHLWSILRGGG